MGGIKNKLSKLIYEPPFRKRRQMKSGRISIGGFDRVLKLTKYTSLACLSLAILSTIALNLISTYSSSNIESNAESIVQSENGLADGPATVSLYIHDATGSCTDTSNPANVCMEIPDGGGMATGGHTVTIAAYGVGWRLGFGSGTDSGLSNGDFSIPSIDSASVVAELPNNTWGYGEWSDGHEFAGYQKVSSTGLSQTISYVYGGDRSPAKQYTNDIHIQYSVRVDRPGQMLAGNYSANVVYLLEPQLIPGPQIDSITPTDYTIDGGDATAVIQGDYLATTYDIYMERDGIKYSLKDSVTSVEMRRISFTIPANGIQPGDYTIHVVTQGGEGTIGFTYTEKQLPDGMLQSTTDYGSDGHVAVDYDENMMPITYTGNETTPKWVIADTSNSNSDTNLNWYDYPNKKWANAVTLTEEGLSLYKGQPVGTEIDEQYVLGYWVYIPRYAYEVMRPNAVDRVVAAQNFDIKFEVASDTKKVPAASCNLNIISMSQMWKSGHATHAGPTSSEILAKDYRSSCGIERDYPGDNDALANKTTWATHPAFTRQYTTEVNGFDKTVELNGIWIGKFETTGGETSPTILPNHPHIGEGDGMGRFFGIAKNIGYPDELNKYGDDVSTKANSHNFSTQSTHMTKNGEYAAAAYLSASKFGAGVNQVQINSQYADMTDDDGNESKGITGCGPSKSWNWSHYADTGIVGQNSACSKSNSKRAYNGSIGMLASSTGNVYGVYDMVGGGYDVVSAAWTNAPNEYLGTTFKGGVRPPYIDLYESSTFKATGAMWSLTRNDTGSYVYNDFDVCTWDTCGGKAMHEVKTVQSINGRNYTWGWEDSGDNDFPCKRYPILVFGLGAGDGSQDGPGAGVSIFATSTDYSVTFYLYAFRVTSISPVV